MDRAVVLGHSSCDVPLSLAGFPRTTGTIGLKKEYQVSIFWELAGEFSCAHISGLVAHFEYAQTQQRSLTSFQGVYVFVIRLAWTSELTRNMERLICVAVWSAWVDVHLRFFEMAAETSRQVEVLMHLYSSEDHL